MMLAYTKVLQLFSFQSPLQKFLGKKLMTRKFFRVLKTIKFKKTEASVFIAIEYFGKGKKNNMSMHNNDFYVKNRQFLNEK